MADLTRCTDRPLDLFTQMRREMDDAFKHWFGRGLAAQAPGGWPPSSQLFTPCELTETDSEYGR